jgi:pimeloyl-ACP methyl ester carboxylesterase
MVVEHINEDVAGSKMTDLIERYTLALGDNDELRYSLFRREINPVQATPLLICLHPGWSGEAPPAYYGEHFLSTIFVPAFMDAGARIVAPDCPGGAWNHPKSRRAILNLLDHLINQFEVDLNRVSLVGYSAGGWGIWYLLQENSEKFASAILLATLPIIDPVERFEENIPKCRELLTSHLGDWLDRVPTLPIHIIHSLDDELLPYEDANRAYQALVGDKKPVTFETVQGAGHFEGESYIKHLQETVPWLINTWGL